MHPIFTRRRVAALLPALLAPQPGRASTPALRQLLTAARRGDGAALRAALAAGADVNGTDPHQEQTALIRAAMFGRASVARELLAGGADPAKLHRSIAQRIGGVLNPGTPVGEVEALQRAVRSRRGLDPLVPEAPERGWALVELAHRANRPGAEALAAELIAAGARVDARDPQGRTPRQIVEDWLPRQKDAAYRAEMGRVLERLRRAEGR